MTTTAACSCVPYVAGGDGPEIDCPVHGAYCVCGRRIGEHSVGDVKSTGRSDERGLLFIVEGCRVAAGYGYDDVIGMVDYPSGDQPTQPSTAAVRDPRAVDDPSNVPQDTAH